jgi:hypothetical protein
MSSHEQLLHLSRETVHNSRRWLASYVSEKPITDAVIRSAHERVCGSLEALCGDSGSVAPFSWFRPTTLREGCEEPS